MSSEDIETETQVAPVIIPPSRMNAAQAKDAVRAARLEIDRVNLLLVGANKLSAARETRMIEAELALGSAQNAAAELPCVRQQLAAALACIAKLQERIVMLQLKNKTDNSVAPTKRPRTDVEYPAPRSRVSGKSILVPPPK